jgi:hypothetical protein
MSNANTKHSHEVVFGRKVDGCPRCSELLAGAAPRKQAWRGKVAAMTAARIAEIRNHDCLASKCGPVCTHGDH